LRTIVSSPYRKEFLDTCPLGRVIHVDSDSPSAKSAKQHRVGETLTRADLEDIHALDAAPQLTLDPVLDPDELSIVSIRGLPVVPSIRPE
jgi:hypothetical protein